MSNNNKARFEIFKRASLWDEFTGKERWYWRLVAANGEPIAVGAEPFKSLSNVKRAIKTVQKYVDLVEDVVVA